MDEFWWYGGAVACAVCTVIGTIGNGLTIAIFVKFPKFRNAIGYLILSLAVVDLLSSVFVTTINAYFFANKGKWQFSREVCIFNEVMTYGNVATSATVMFLIAINRCIKICYPAKIYQKLYSNNLCVAITIAVAWIYSHVIFFLTMFNIGGELIHNEQTKTCALALRTSWIVLVVAFCVMSVVIIICYAKIYNKVERSRRSVRRQNVNFDTEGRANIRLVKMLVATTVAYVLGFLGPLIMGLTAYFSGKQGQKSPGCDLKNK